MLPQLLSKGFLPPGVHRSTLQEVVAAFGISTPRRRELADRLREILDVVLATGHVRRIFLWGSFPTAKPDPADVDLMLVMSREFRSELCSSAERRVFDAEVAERELGATVLWTREDVPTDLLTSFLDQWQIDRGGRRRGIVEVMR